MALKKLSIKNTEIVQKILALIDESGVEVDKNTPVKIDRSAGEYPPVYIRIYHEDSNAQASDDPNIFVRIVIAKGEYDSDGTFHADPEIRLGYFEAYNQMFPYFASAGSGRYRAEKRAAEFDADGKIIWENEPEVQRDVHSFASSIIKQIDDQQDLSLSDQAVA